MKNKTLSAHALFKSYMLCQKKMCHESSRLQNQMAIEDLEPRLCSQYKLWFSLHEHRFISSSSNPVSRGELLTNTSPRLLLTVTCSERKYIHNFFEMFHLIESASCCVFEVFWSGVIRRMFHGHFSNFAPTCIFVFSTQFVSFFI